MRSTHRPSPSRSLSRTHRSPATRSLLNPQIRRLNATAAQISNSNAISTVTPLIHLDRLKPIRTQSVPG
ncbi:hypothetical protein KFK09_017867 [Dendrobium nobile]|uniref:Uncharacterized protein n=1 Tax=Dendrobium nobile TaxID=94219 RepID=A0A8T3ATM5_DENNO|nr:hypothetical protein KFK09_017867 [Dendrobium nobile]